MRRKSVGIAVVLVLAGLMISGPALAQDDAAPDETPPEAAPAEPVDAAPADAEEAPAAPAAPVAEEAPAEPAEPVAAAPVEPVAAAPAPAAADEIFDDSAEADGEDVTAETEVGAGAEATLEADVATDKPAIWRNTLFIYSNFVSANSFNKSAELTHNPYYGMSYRFVPRIYLYKGMSLRLDWALEQELTNSDSTTKKHEIYWSDLSLDWVWGGAATIPGIDVSFTPKVRFTIPASKSSQARTLYTAIGPGFDFLKTFDVAGGLTLQWAFRYTKYFNKYTGPVSEDPLVECSGSAKSCPFYALGPRNPSHSFTNSFYLGFSPTDKLHLAMQVAVVNRLLYKNSETDVDILGGTYEVNESSKNTNHQGLMRYIFEVAYDVLPFMTVALGADTYNPMLSPNSQYYAPFFNRYTNIYLDFTIYPEVIVSNLTSKGKKTDLEKDLH